MVTYFATFYTRLVRTAMLLVDDKETAEDVVMDAFVGLRVRWRAVRDPADVFGYLRSSVLNGARSKLRRRRVQRLVDRPRRPEPDPSAETLALDRDEQSTLAAAVRRLPQRQREVIVLRYYLDMSEAQIAETLGIGTGSVKSHASRAIHSLAQQVEAMR
jgi:RNA polymerase sigma-70 factor (sigma-E family)